jgi:copper homeostasis protein (lipoprotein)
MKWRAIAAATAASARGAGAFLLLLAACASDPPPEAAASAPRLDLPATFIGDLPCADCEALREHLDLRADGTYALRNTYIGRSSAGFDEIGRWTIDAAGRTLALHGARAPPLRFEIRDATTLRMLDRAGRPIESKLNFDLKRRAVFAPIEPALRMRGLYSYMADAGFFTECLTGQRLPVAHEGDNAALEAAYAKARPAPGATLLATLDGRIASRMPMEGPGPKPTLIVERFRGISPGADCSAPLAKASSATTALEGTQWTLTRVGALSVAAGAAQRTPNLTLQAAEKRAVGSSGCNRFTGSYSLQGERLKFGSVASTKMACPQGMDIERAFLDALARTATWRIAGGRLDLLDAAGQSLAQFEPR